MNTWVIHLEIKASDYHNELIIESPTQIINSKWGIHLKINLYERIIESVTQMIIQMINSGKRCTNVLNQLCLEPFSLAKQKTKKQTCQANLIVILCNKNSLTLLQ